VGAQPPHHLALADQDLPSAGRQCNLENGQATGGGLGLEVADEERPAGRTRAEPPHYVPASGEDVARDRLQRILRRPLGRGFRRRQGHGRGQRLLDELEHLQELVYRGQPS
jgi:hypothetical protein